MAELGHVPDLKVLVVDDGSGADYAGIFADAARAGAEVLVHEVNAAKGSPCVPASATSAISTRTSRWSAPTPTASTRCSTSCGSRPPDSGELVLGVRRSARRVPLRSRLGNRITAAVFTVPFTGTRLPDTQTGLRGYPAGLLDWASAALWVRFEYELNLLLRATRDRLPIRQIEIATVYHADNASSHFRPVRDPAHLPSVVGLRGFIIRNDLQGF